jgi:hypothetical protein
MDEGGSRNGASISEGAHGGGPPGIRMEAHIVGTLNDE